MTSVSPPRAPHRPPEREWHPPLRWNRWNLLLLVPLLSLLTPLYNRVEPRLFGIPFFYWFQLLVVLIGIGATAAVYVMTRDDSAEIDNSDRFGMDYLDEGTAR